LVLDNSRDQSAPAQEYLCNRSGSDAGTVISLMLNQSLCITYSASSLSLTECSPDLSVEQLFTYGKAEIKMQIVHKSTGMCATSKTSKVGDSVELEKCIPSKASQLWVYGSSGRFCQGPCITAAKVSMEWGPDYIGRP